MSKKPTLIMNQEKAVSNRDISRSATPFVAVRPGPITVRVATLLVTLGLLLVLSAAPALAQAGGGISAALGDIVLSITDIIQGLTVVVGILGLTLWGFAKVARPIFPELSQLTNQYVGQFVLGVVVVFVAATIVEEIAAAVGG
jgi:type IV secretory pathway VirB2 component (pilin)